MGQATDLLLFLDRIDEVESTDQPKYGQMNVHQMICHCADQLRLALGTIKASKYGNIDPKEVTRLARAKETVPVPEGLDQCKGEGTQPVDFENDKQLLKDCLMEFIEKDDSFDYAPHPYYGDQNKQWWVQLTNYHLNHHLRQFNR